MRKDCLSRSVLPALKIAPIRRAEGRRFPAPAVQHASRSYIEGAHHGSSRHTQPGSPRRVWAAGHCSWSTPRGYRVVAVSGDVWVTSGWIHRGLHPAPRTIGDARLARAGRGDFVRTGRSRGDRAAGSGCHIEHSPMSAQRRSSGHAREANRLRAQAMQEAFDAAAGWVGNLAHRRSRPSIARSTRQRPVTLVTPGAGTVGGTRSDVAPGRPAWLASPGLRWQRALPAGSSANSSAGMGRPNR